MRYPRLPHVPAPPQPGSFPSRPLSPCGREAFVLGMLRRVGARSREEVPLSAFVGGPPAAGAPTSALVGRWPIANLPTCALVGRLAAVEVPIFAIAEDSTANFRSCWQVACSPSSPKHQLPLLLAVHRPQHALVGDKPGGESPTCALVGGSIANFRFCWRVADRLSLLLTEGLQPRRLRSTNLC